MSLESIIMGAIAPIQEGRSVTLPTCPFCSSRGKFTATVRGDKILFNCYRASCTESSGWFPIKMTGEERVAAIRSRKLLTKPETWTIPSYWIDGIGDNKCYQYMIDTNMMGAYETGIFRPMYDPAERRFIFNIVDSGGMVCGAVGRTMVRAIPKVLNYNPNYSQPFIARRGRVGILAEDCASAVAATRHSKISGISLLGTTIRKDFILHLLKFDEIIVALDRDAYSKSVKLQKQLLAYIKNVRVLRLHSDIKDTPKLQYIDMIEEFLG